MAFEGKRLRDLTEADIRGLITAGVAEHLYVEYKSEMYGTNHEGRREFLLDVCMFANAQGGLLLIGVPEQRDRQGQPTGLPDPAAELGVETANPEAQLHSYDARIVSCIGERLTTESHPVPLANGRHVLAIRIPDSTQKPHCVTLEGHTYFPSRRERHRYFMDVREIKELTMRVASQLERARALAEESLRGGQRDGPTMTAVLVPVFFGDFLVDVKNDSVYQSLRQFHLSEKHTALVAPGFSLEGLKRTDTRDTVTLGRNGVISLVALLHVREGGQGTSVRGTSVSGAYEFYPTQIDVFLRLFIMRARSLCSAAAIPSPMLLAMSLQSNRHLVALDPHGFPDSCIEGGTKAFPILQIGDIFDPAESLIRPLCDVAYQMFGYKESPCFTAEGNWNGPIV